MGLVMVILSLIMVREGVIYESKIDIGTLWNNVVGSCEIQQEVGLSFARV